MQAGRLTCKASRDIGQARTIHGPTLHSMNPMYMLPAGTRLLYGLLGVFFGLMLVQMNQNGVDCTLGLRDETAQLKTSPTSSDKQHAMLLYLCQGLYEAPDLVKRALKPDPCGRQKMVLDVGERDRDCT